MEKHAIMLRDNPKARSFTLVELIVAVSIALMMMGAGAFMLSKNSGMSQLNSDTELLSTFISRARNLAANPDDQDALGYGVRSKTSDDRQFEIFRRKASMASPSEITDSVIDSIALTGSKIAPPISVFFSSPAGTYSGPTISFTLTLLKKPTQKTIEISAPGYVNVKSSSGV